jgi:hypothetical protein
MACHPYKPQNRFSNLQAAKNHAKVGVCESMSPVGGYLFSWLEELLFRLESGVYRTWPVDANSPEDSMDMISLFPNRNVPLKEPSPFLSSSSLLHYHEPVEIASAVSPHGIEVTASPVFVPYRSNSHGNR